MHKAGAIEEHFKEYLESNLDPAMADTLASSLHRLGLHDESRALRMYVENGPGTEFHFEADPWSSHRCVLGTHPPRQAEPGLIWFDVVELIPMVLISEPNEDADRAFLLSTHPAYVWQFLTFLRMVRFREVSTNFKRVDDLMSPDRFASMDRTAFVTDVYHEEAVAYAHWFGKYLCRRFDLRMAREVLSIEEFSSVLPYGMKLWDEVQYSLSEFVRIAVSNDTLTKDPDEEFELQSTAAATPTPDRMVYGEWDRESYIGLSTTVFYDTGLLANLPRMAYEFLELENSAPRPSPPI
jgi:hypothetical protein